jgi:hypothetical protein
MGLQIRERRGAEKKFTAHPRIKAKGVAFFDAPRQHGATAAASDTPGGSGTMVPRGLSAFTPTRTAVTGQRVAAPTVSSLPLDNMLRIVIVVQHFVTEFNGAVSE